MKNSYKSFGFALIFVLIVNCQMAQTPSVVAVQSTFITQGLSTPIRIAIDKADIKFVTDASQKLILKYDEAGNFMGTINPGGSPISIAINKDNRIFFGDAESGKIFKLNDDGTKEVFYSGTLFPSSMVFGPEENLFVVDIKLNVVLVINSSGNFVRSIGNGLFTFPAGINYNPKNNRILVSEHGGLGTGFNPVVRVYLFTPEGTLMSTFGSHGNGNGRFYRIQGMNVNRCGNIFVTDPFQGNVSVFNESGTFISKFGAYGEASDQLNMPLDIAIDSRDRLWISSMNNGSLVVYQTNFSLPTSHISSAAPFICTGGSTNIKVDFTGNPPWTFTYTRNGANPQTVSNTYSNPYTLNVASAGTYRITALSDASAAGSCFSGTVVVTETNISPTAAITSGNASICAGQTSPVSIDLTGTTPWTFSYSINGSVQTSVTTSNTPYIISASQNGNYELTAVSGAGCTGTYLTGSANIAVHPLPEAEILSGNVAICEGESADIVIQFTGTSPWNFTYTINDNPVNLSGTSDNPFVLNVTDEGVYKVTALSDALCSGTIFTGSAEVSVSPVPSMEISSISASCAGVNDGSAEAIVLSGTSPFYFEWNTNPVQTQATATGLGSGTYMVTLTDGSNCKISSSVYVAEPPSIQLSMVPPAVLSQFNTCAFGTNANIVLGYGSGPASARLNANASGGIPPYSYTWHPATGLSNPLIKNPVFTPPVPVPSCSVYEFMLTVTDASNCSVTAVEQVRVVNVADQAGNSGNQKVLICHNSSGNSEGGNTLSISSNAVSAHISGNGSGHANDCFGRCNDCPQGSKISFADAGNYSENGSDDLKGIFVEVFPNPFNSKTVISFSLSEKSHVRIEIYDIIGKKELVLFENIVQENTITKAEFDAGEFSGGVYLYKIVTDENVITGKMILIGQ